MIVQETKFLYVLSEDEARKKIGKWYADKKKLSILSCIPGQHGDKGYEIVFSYEEPAESI